ncbi:MAG: TrkA C-terminal domain-containing protein, partial [Gemmatimonadota bacterium]
RDRLVWGRFAEVGRFGTPTLAITFTSLVMIVAIVALDVEAIAKLASAFMLLLFAFLNLTVIIMRESGIEAYDPGYRSPLYPWMQIFGMLGPVWLITEMGEMAVLFTLGMVAAAIGWYLYYVRGRVGREGAIYHTFARLGERRDDGLALELRGIVKERGLRDEDPFDEVVARAHALDVDELQDFTAVAERAAVILSRRTGVEGSHLRRGFLDELAAGVVPVAGGAAIPHLRAPGIEHPEMVLVRSRSGIRLGDRAEDPGRVPASAASDGPPRGRVHALFFLVSPEDQPGQHLRLLGHLATHVDDAAFLDGWLAAEDEEALKGTLLREERAISVRLSAAGPTAELVGKRLLDVRLPAGTLVAVIRRGSTSTVPHGRTLLEAGDRLTIIGEPGGIREVAGRYGLDSGVAGMPEPA